MELKDVQSLFLTEASKLGDYSLLSKTELAEGYCDADDKLKKLLASGASEYEVTEYESLRSGYYAALMLRYWYKIYDWIKDSASLQLEATDFVDWLNDALSYALKSRPWRNPEKAVYGDPNGPDKVINQCCASERLIVYQYYNKEKRKGITRNYSLDGMIDDNGDCAATYAGAITRDGEISGIKSLMYMLMNKGEGVEALIVDGIANYDTYKEKKSKVTHEEVVDDATGEKAKVEYTKVDMAFDPRKLVRHLTTLNKDFVTDLCANYSDSKELADSTFNKLKKMNNTKLYKYIQKTLIELKQTPEFLECLTNN